MMKKSTPIAIFVYNRPAHTARMLASLAQNPLEQRSNVFVFCDGARSDSDRDAVRETRSLVKEKLPSATIVERERNLGLAESVISGVTQCVNEWGRAIVLEDDLVLSPTLLEYFNQALDHYEPVPRVAHISGYMFPVRNQVPELFFYREMTCWGWATWKRAWDKLDQDPSRLLAKIRARNVQHEFDVKGTISFTTMLEKQCKAEIDSWAIRWYATNFLIGGLALHPGKSLVSNKGFDGSGVHSGASGERFEVTVHDSRFSYLPEQVEESTAALEAMIEYRGHQSSKRVQLTREFARLLGRVRTLLQ